MHGKGGEHNADTRALFMKALTMLMSSAGTEAARAVEGAGVLGQGQRKIRR
jgi:hypothetical protein